jgi:hypothetical protein
MIRQLFLSAILAGFLAGCASTALYNQQAYDYQVQAKVEVDHLIAKATGPYDAVAVEQAQKVLDHAYEYDAHRGLNRLTLEEWLILRDRFKKFTDRWKAEGPRSSAFVAEKRAVVAKGFDSLIQTEAGKIHGSQ